MPIRSIGPRTIVHCGRGAWRGWFRHGRAGCGAGSRCRRSAAWSSAPMSRSAPTRRSIAARWRHGLEDDVKLDNQIQIGHNCRIGAHTAIAGCVGIAGSTRIGKNCKIGGAAMIDGPSRYRRRDNHLRRQPACSTRLPKPGLYRAFPAMPHQEWRHVAAIVRRLRQWTRSRTRAERKTTNRGNDHG